MKKHHGFAKNLIGVERARKRLEREGYNLLYGQWVCGYILYIEPLGEK